MNNNDDFDSKPNDDHFGEDTVVLADKDNDMSNDNIDTDTNIDLNLSIGQTLRQLREKKSLKIEQLADNLRLDVSTIEHLEKDEYKRLPPAIFVQGYIRSYAKFVGAEPEHLIRQYYQQEGNAPNLQYAAPQGIRGSADHEVMNSERRNKKKSGSSSFSSFLLLLLLILGAAYLWQQNYINKEMFSFLQPTEDDGNINVITDPGLAPPNLPNGSLDTAVLEPNLSNSDDNSSYIPPQEDAGEDNPAMDAENTTDNVTDAPENTEAVVLNAEEENTAITATENTDNALESNVEASSEPSDDTENAEVAEVAIAPPVDKLDISFSGASWTEVYDATGKRLYYRTSIKGSSESFTGTPPFKVRMGKPEVTNIQYLGEEMNLKRYNGRVTTIKIGQEQ